MTAWNKHEEVLCLESGHCLKLNQLAPPRPFLEGMMLEIWVDGEFIVHVQDLGVAEYGALKEVLERVCQARFTC